MNKWLKYNASPYILLVIYLLVNDVFLLKYVPASPIVKGIVILLYSAFVGLLYILSKKKQVASRWLNSPYLLLAAIPLILLLYVKVSPFSVTPDRWSALYYWSENLFHGIYPYAARTHMGGYGSPFPIWQLAHIPFYWLGDEIFAHIVMLLVLIFFLNKNKALVSANIFSILLLCAPAYWWEVLVRSDLLNNMLLAMLLVWSLDKFKKEWQQSSFLTGCILGLACCTRIFIFLPILIYIVPILATIGWRARIYLFIGWALGFVLPFVPIYCWNANMLLHFKFSPIVLQIRQGSILTFIVGLILVSGVSLLWKSLFQYFWITACFLFLFIVMMFLRKVYYDGLIASMFFDGFDLSYFSIALPFVLVGLALKNNNNKEKLSLSLLQTHKR